MPGWTNNRLRLEMEFYCMLWADYGLDPSKIRILLTESSSSIVLLEHEGRFYVGAPIVPLMYMIEEPLDLESILLDLREPNSQPSKIRTRELESLVDDEGDE